MFRTVLFNKSLPHFFTDFRIAEALLNTYREPFHDSVYATEFVERISHRIHVNNDLGSYVVAENVNRQRVAFRTLIDESINMPFPELSNEDIILFSLRTYHLKLAASYVSEHLRDGVYNIDRGLCNSKPNYESIRYRHGRLRSAKGSNFIKT
ncbi:hypothetical protein PYW08_011348 [Mythimna loreyi]|uniref:Uncharacterized protein n=1 Tax=Mythimna loreyi TaxID=667449 RepID=A0ACC2Q5H3_9NEOP|nr:hypothetical protein PYW08_011348 [Mythimna loreyi]